MNDFFSILNPDLWMNENNSIVQIVDAILFFLLFIPVIYFFICALFSLSKYKNPYPVAKEQHRFLILFTVFRDSKEVFESINHFLSTQVYPRDKYDITVVATELQEQDLVTLLQMPVNIIVPDKEQCTKIYAIQQVMKRYSPTEYDMIVIFNSDNRITPNALELFNNAYYSGCDSIQAHLMEENLTTGIAVLNAASEEISNSLFRKAHTRMGFSSALADSAMAFDFAIFHEIAPTLKGADLSKLMEVALLRQNIYTEYLEEVICYSRKEENSNHYDAQRTGWSRSKHSSMFFAFKQLPWVLLKGEWDYSVKLFQWLMPSRCLLIALVTLCTISITLLDWTLCFKWYILSGVVAVTFIMALPKGEISKRVKYSIWVLPVFVLTSVFSRFTCFFQKKSNNR